VRANERAAAAVGFADAADGKPAGIGNSIRVGIAGQAPRCERACVRAMYCGTSVQNLRSVRSMQRKDEVSGMIQYNIGPYVSIIPPWLTKIKPGRFQNTT
jgi:hypothetical protein